LASDPYRLWRFLDAQRLVYDRSRLELSRGRKESHWMWFIFPQIAGLGMSPMSQRYAIQSLEEARAYLAHPILGGRLRDCTALVNGMRGRTASDIFGTPDDLKFRSSMTLFVHAGRDNRIYLDALDKYFGGQFDLLTLAKLGMRENDGEEGDEG
jgi:uncharacterized protein (DUF1810 family)